MFKNIKQWISLTYIGIASLAIVLLLIITLVEHSQSTIIIVPIIGALIAASFGAYAGAHFAGVQAEKNHKSQLQVNTTRINVDAGNELALKMEYANIQLLSLATEFNKNKHGGALEKLLHLPQNITIKAIDFQVEKIIFVVLNKTEFESINNVKFKHVWRSPTIINQIIEQYNIFVKRWNMHIEENNKFIQFAYELEPDEFSSTIIKKELIDKYTLKKTLALVINTESLLLYIDHLILVLSDFIANFPTIIQNKTDSNIRKENGFIVVFPDNLISMQKNMSNIDLVEIEQLFGKEAISVFENIKSGYEPHIKYIKDNPKTPAPGG
jgi:hypothetical protein